MFWIDLVAQLVEHNTFNVGVTGSNPVGVTICWVNLLMVEAGCLSSIRCRFDSVTQYKFIEICSYLLMVQATGFSVRGFGFDSR